MEDTPMDVQRVRLKVEMLGSASCANKECKESQGTACRTFLQGTASGCASITAFNMVLRWTNLSGPLP